MPRPNKDRTIGREELVAQRIAAYRQSFDPPMTYDDLAGRMTSFGCPIRPSALFKIEKGQPRRKISVDELVAFSQVLGVPVEQLVARPAHDTSDEAELAIRRCRTAYEEWLLAQQRTEAAVQEAASLAENLAKRWLSLKVVLDQLPPDVAAVYRAEIVDLDSRLPAIDVQALVAEAAQRASVAKDDT